MPMSMPSPVTSASYAAAPPPPPGATSMSSLSSISDDLCAPPPPAELCAPVSKSMAYESEPMMLEKAAAPMKKSKEKKMSMKKSSAKMEEECEMAMDDDVKESESMLESATVEDTPNANSASSSSVQIQSWTPDVPYLNQIKSLALEKQYDEVKFDIGICIIG